jgi:hypothetical protein
MQFLLFSKGELMATKPQKKAAPAPAADYDVSDALRDQRLERIAAIRTGMMSGQDADDGLLDRTDRKNWPDITEI